MEKTNHHEHPELWFRSSPLLPLDVLSKLIERKKLTATPRLGKRDETHWKGYSPMQIVTLRVLDSEGKELLNRKIRIIAVRTKPLQKLVKDDLETSVVYRNWKEVQAEFAFFEGHPVPDDETVSIIEFVYL